MSPVENEAEERVADSNVDPPSPDSSVRSDAIRSGAVSQSGAAPRVPRPDAAPPKRSKSAPAGASGALAELRIPAPPPVRSVQLSGKPKLAEAVQVPAKAASPAPARRAPSTTPPRRKPRSERPGASSVLPPPLVQVPRPAQSARSASATAAAQPEELDIPIDSEMEQSSPPVEESARAKTDQPLRHEVEIPPPPEPETAPEPVAVAQPKAVPSTGVSLESGVDTAVVGLTLAELRLRVDRYAASVHLPTPQPEPRAIGRHQPRIRQSALRRPTNSWASAQRAENRMSVQRQLIKQRELAVQRQRELRCESTSAQRMRGRPRIKALEPAQQPSETETAGFSSGLATAQQKLPDTLASLKPSALLTEPLSSALSNKRRALALAAATLVLLLLVYALL